MHVLIIALVVVGILAIFLEMLMPGWDSYVGVLIGIVAFVVAAAVAVITQENAMFFIGALLVMVVVGGYGTYLFIKRKQLHGNIILTEVDDAPQQDLSSFMGKEGRTVTLLRPSGDVDFNGVRMQVTSDGPLIEKNTKVRVVEIQATKIVVTAIN